VVRLEDGTSRVVTFAGKNGQRYEAVGAELVRRGAIPREQLSMQAIRAWLAANPSEQDALLARNPSYVFFRFAEAATGSLGVPVTPDRTIAADPRVFPKGGLAFAASERPVDATGPAMRPFARFVSTRTRAARSGRAPTSTCTSGAARTPRTRRGGCGSRGGCTTCC
jgi:membrane-bound lytic murein transglycosylase A